MIMMKYNIMMNQYNDDALKPKVYYFSVKLKQDITLFLQDITVPF